MLGINITRNAIESHMDIADCITAERIMSVTIDKEHLSMLSDYVLHGWPSRVEVQKDLQPYWSFRDEIAVINGIVLKTKRIMIPASLQGKGLNCT